MDFAGPFMGKFYFFAVDAHSKWPEMLQMSPTTTEQTIAVMRQLFAHFGLPEQVISDIRANHMTSSQSDRSKHVT